MLQETSHLVSRNTRSLPLRRLLATSLPIKTRSRAATTPTTTRRRRGRCAGKQQPLLSVAAGPPPKKSSSRGGCCGDRGARWWDRSMEGSGRVEADGCRSLRDFAFQRRRRVAYMRRHQRCQVMVAVRALRATTTLGLQPPLASIKCPCEGSPHSNHTPITGSTGAGQRVTVGPDPSAVGVSSAGASERGGRRRRAAAASVVAEG